MSATAPQRLEAEGLRKSYKGRAVVDGVSLAVSPGEIVGLLGPNGAGKTTTFYMIVGLVAPDAGRVVLGGRELARLPLHKRARLGLGYLPQEASVFRRLNVRQNVELVLEGLDIPRATQRERATALLEELGISHLERSMAQSLSGGERRRLEIARALALGPSLMLLDEPFAGVDPLAVGDIQSLIRHLKDRGIGVLITDHNWRETLSICDRAAIMSRGRIVAEGAPDELRASPVVKEAYLGEQA